MQGQNIVCFAKDWREAPTSNNHVMRHLARDNRVLWLNSIASRAPSFGNGRDLRKIARKLKSFGEGLEQVDDNMWVFTPLVAPYPHNPLAHAVNRRILRTTLTLLRKKLGMDSFQLWSFLPTAAEYVGHMGENGSVYFITDEFSQFSSMNKARVADMDRRMCERCDVVFVTGNSLLEAKKDRNPETHLASHGVDHAHFARALSDDLPVPADVARLNDPVIGFIGLIEDWVQLELIEHMADRHPDWSFVMVGPVRVDISRADARPNIHFLGRRPYETLPAYCRKFSVALIPFALNDLTVHVNPIKLREYLSAGVPVVSTSLPEVVACGGDCRIADEPAAFMTEVEAAIAGDSPERRAARSRAMETETWAHKASEIGDHVMRALNHG